MKTMTLNLPEPEMGRVDELSRERDMAKTALIRHAIRFFDVLNARLKRGERMVFVDSDGKEVQILPIEPVGWTNDNFR